MGIGVLPWVASAAWAASELYFVVRTGAGHVGSRKGPQDKGSYWLVAVGIYSAIGIAFLAHARRWGWASPPVANLGAVLMLVGVALRLRSVHVLGRSFSLVVSADSGQAIVRSGPYRLLRHPAYSGSLLTLTSWGLALNSWVASCVTLPMLAAAFIYRIRVEEEALTAALGTAYEDYKRSTWRLIPHVW